MGCQGKCPGLVLPPGPDGSYHEGASCVTPLPWRRVQIRHRRLHGASTRASSRASAGKTEWPGGSWRPVCHLENSYNSLKNLNFSLETAQQKNFQKRDLTPKAGLRYKEGLIARRTHQTVYFRYVTGLPMFFRTCITWGKSPEIPRKTRVSGYPHLWRTMWITPKPLWKRSAGAQTSTDCDNPSS